MNGDDDVVVKRREEFDEKAPKYRKWLVAYALRKTRDYTLAEDVAQQSILDYLEWREAGEWQQLITNEYAYLRAIVRNLLTDKGRAESKTKLVSLDEPAADQGQKGLEPRAETFDVDKQIYLEELRETIPLKTILGKLSENQKTLLWLRVVERMSYKEIAQEVNENPIIVRYELQRMMATVRARVRKIFGIDTTLFKSDV